MIRFLDAAGVAVPIYAVEIDGTTYAPGELAGVVTSRGRTACALCGVSIVQKPAGRKRKYCEACARKLGHRTTGAKVRSVAGKNSPR